MLLGAIVRYIFKHVKIGVISECQDDKLDFDRRQTESYNFN